MESPEINKSFILDLIHFENGKRVKYRGMKQELSKVYCVLKSTTSVSHIIKKLYRQGK